MEEEPDTDVVDDAAAAVNSLLEAEIVVEAVSEDMVVEAVSGDSEPEVDPVREAMTADHGPTVDELVSDLDVVVAWEATTDAVKLLGR